MRSIKVITILIVIMTLMSADSALLMASSPGSTSANFLKIPVGARATAMGESFVSVADDSNAVYWNPAGIKNINRPQISLLHTRWLSDMSYQYLTAVLPLSQKWSAGFGAYYFNYGEIQGWDYLGYKTGSLNASDIAISFSAATSLKEVIGIQDDLYWGMSVKYIAGNLANRSANTIGSDMGFFYRKKFYNQSVSAGISARNFMGGLKFISREYPLPSNIAIGATYKFDQLAGVDDPIIFTLETNVPSDNKPYFNVGTEYWIVNLIAVRVGYKSGGYDIGSGIRAGVGVKVYTMEFDMAFGGYDKLGDTYHFGLTYKFGEPVKPRITTTPITSDEIETLIKSGRKLYDDGRYVECMMELNKVLDVDPTNRVALDLMKDANSKLQSEKSKKLNGDNNNKNDEKK